MPGRDCDTCKHYRPFESLKLSRTFGKCTSPDKPLGVSFAELCRGDPSLCGPSARWWSGKPPQFELVEDDPPSRLDWLDGEEET